MVYPYLVTFCSGSGGGSGIISHNNLKFTSLVHHCSQSPVLFGLFPPIIEKTFQLTAGNLTSALIITSEYHNEMPWYLLEHFAERHFPNFP